MAQLTPEKTRFMASLRVAHLATAGPAAVPHVVPVCFALAGDRCYIAIDEKPKPQPKPAPAAEGAEDSGEAAPEGDTGG